MLTNRQLMFQTKEKQQQKQQPRFYSATLSSLGTMAKHGDDDDYNGDYDEADDDNDEDEE